MALAPLSNMLNKTVCGYNVEKTKIDHLFYIDDLKLYAKDDNNLETLLHTVHHFSNDINMTFGLDKCAKVTFKRGRLMKSTNIQLDIHTVIKELEQEETYKYLGVDESDGIQHSKMKEKVRREYYRRVRLVLQSELNGANKIQAINTLAVPVVTYSFNVINWKLSELRRLDSKTRKYLTMNRMHHPRADVDRLYVKRKEGGRGLIQIENAYITSTIGLDMYLQNNHDPLLRLVYQHDKGKNIYSIHKESNKFKTQCDRIAEQEPPLPSDSDTEKARKIKKKYKDELHKQQVERWHSKVLHGQYPTQVSKDDVDNEKTYSWLRSTGLKAETEGFVIAAQVWSLKIF